MRHRGKRATVLIAAGMMLASLASAPAAQAVTTGKLLVYQGDITYWWTIKGGNSGGTDHVGGVLAQHDVVIISHAKARNSSPTGCGGSGCWPNAPHGATGHGCDTVDHRATWIKVLAKAKQLKPTLKVFGYVAGTADAAYVGGVSPECGNKVNNYVGDPGLSNPPPYPTVKFLTCPNGICLNFVSMVGDWLSGTDALPSYINGIFIDYVTSVHMTAAIRDNLYSYIRTWPGKLIAVNSTVPGDPCAACTGNVNNYRFAADSSYMQSTDYVLVEGYYAAGYSGNGGAATLLPNETAQIGGNYGGYPASTSVRTTVANARGGVKPRLAALVTEPSDAAFTTLSCTWADFTYGKQIFDASKVANDVIAFQFADLGLDLTRSPPTAGKFFAACG